MNKTNADAIVNALKKEYEQYGSGTDHYPYACGHMALLLYQLVNGNAQKRYFARTTVKKLIEEGSQP